MKSQRLHFLLLLAGLLLFTFVPSRAAVLVATGFETSNTPSYALGTLPNTTSLPVRDQNLLGTRQIQNQNTATPFGTPNQFLALGGANLRAVAAGLTPLTRVSFDFVEPAGTSNNFRWGFGAADLTPTSAFVQWVINNGSVTTGDNTQLVSGTLPTFVQGRRYLVHMLLNRSAGSQSVTLPAGGTITVAANQAALLLIDTVTNTLIDGGRYGHTASYTPTNFWFRCFSFDGNLVYIDNFVRADDLQIVPPPALRRWDGGAADNDWSTAANWVGDQAPAPGDPLVFSGNVRTTPSNNFPAGTSFTGIEFDALASAFTLTGNSMVLGGSIVNSSGSTQNLSLPLQLDSAISVLVPGSGGINLAGNVTGAGGIAKNGSGPLQFTGTPSFTGLTTVNEGSVIVVADQSAANGGWLIGPSNTASTTVTFNAGSNAAVAAGKQFRLGDTVAAGFSLQTANVSGTMNNAGTLLVGRHSALNLRDGAVWNQLGAAGVESVGGYACLLSIQDGATFHYTGPSAFTLRSGTNDTGKGRIAVDGGTFVTTRAVQNPDPANAFTPRITLQGGGMLRLAASIPALTSGIEMVLGGGQGGIDTAGFETSITTAVSGSGDFVKRGAGTLTFATAPAYTGDTLVQGGTLVLGAPSLAATSSVEIAGGANLTLNFAGTLPVAGLVIDGNALPDGVYHAVSHPGFIAGTGTLTVSVPEPTPIPPTFTHTIATSGGESATVRFSLFPIRSPNFEVLVPLADGSWSIATPEPARTYLGTVDGHPGAVATGLIRSDGSVFCRISFENGVEWSSTGGAAAIRGSSNWSPAWPSTVVPAGGAGSQVFAAETGLDLTYTHFLAAGGTVVRAVEIAEFSVLATNAIYLRDAAIIHRLGKVVVRSRQAFDPYEGISDSTPLLTTLRSQWNAGNPMGTAHDISMVSRAGLGGGLAYVGSIGTSNRYSANGTDANGDFSVVWRHEAGHNWGAVHYEGGGKPEGPTIMSDNSLSRFSSSELLRIIQQRNTRAPLLDNLGAAAVSLPPRANMDRTGFSVSQPVSIDVLENDSDSNGQAIGIVSFDSVTRRGGTVSRSVGTGPGGRDRLVYTPPPSLFSGHDFFTYRIADASGRTATGHVALQPELDEILLAHWPLDSGSGATAFDMGSASRHGTLGGSAGWTTPGRTRPAALSLPGSNSQVEAPGLGTASNTLTIAGWIRPQGLQPGWATIAFTRDSSRGVGLNIRGNSGQLGFHWEYGSNLSFDFVSALVPPVATWTFCALAVSPTVATLYMKADGDILRSASTTGTFEPANLDSPFYLGTDPGNTSRRFTGSMEDFRVFNRTLSLAEIESLAAGGGTAFHPSPAHGTTVTGTQPLQLSWTSPPATLGHRVFFGTSFAAVQAATVSSPEFVGTVTPASFTLPHPGTGRWFWRIDAGDATGYFPGPVWTFTTESGVVSLASQAWNLAATWSNGLAAPVTGTQGTGLACAIRNHVVTSNDPASNSQAWIGQSVAVRESGTLDLARLHTSTGQAATHNLPPLTFDHGSTLQFRASTGTVDHSLSSAISIQGAVSLRLNGSNYSHTATLGGLLSGGGRIDLISDTSSPLIAGNIRSLSLTRANNPYTGDWTLAHTAAGDDFVALRSQSAGALGSGRVTVGTRGILEATSGGTLDSLSGVTLDGPLSELRMNSPWVNDNAPLVLASGSPVVALATATSRIGNLSGITGTIRPLAASGRLRVNQTQDGSYSGTWTGALHLEKQGPATLSLEGSTGTALSTAIGNGTLALTGSANTLASLVLEGGNLALSSADLAAPALTVSGPVTFAGGTIRLVLAQVPAGTTPRTLVASTGLLTGRPVVEVTNSVGTPVPVRVTTGAGGNGSIYLAFNLPPLTFESWIASTTVPAGRRGPEDRNGQLDLPNLLAYTMGIDPMLADATQMPSLARGTTPGEVILTFLRTTDFPGASLAIQSTGGLASWAEADVISASVTPLGNGRERVVARILAPAADRAFFRLQATQP